MARLFIGQREVEFVNDLTKEFMKDVVGQVIHYFPVSSIKSEVHHVYNEAVKKIFDNPIKLPALVNQPAYASKTTMFGPDLDIKIEALLQVRDLLDKKIVPSEGDFFSFDDILYEVTTYTPMNNIFGLAEYNVAIKLAGRVARLNQLDPNNLPPPRLAPDDVQTVFEQQRGLPITNDGQVTSDVRQMRDRLGKYMAPIALETGAKRVERNDDNDNNGDFIEGNKATSFNNDPLPPKKGIYDDE